MIETIYAGKIKVYLSYQRTLSNIPQYDQCSNQLVQEVAERVSRKTPEVVVAEDLSAGGDDLYP